MGECEIDSRSSNIENISPGRKSLDIFLQHEQKLDEHVDTILKGTEALYQKVEDYANLSSRLRKDLQDSPPYLDYSEDKDLQNLIDLFNKDTKQPEINADKRYRITEKEAMIIIDRLDILIKRNQNEAQSKSLSLQPQLLNSTEITVCFRKINEYLKEFLSLILRNIRI